ncbi:MAG: hydrolase [Candidatus Geothermincolales bacterium]
MERHPSLANAGDSLLVIIDPQEKLMRAVERREEISRNMRLILRFAPIYGIPVVLTEHYPQGLGSTVEEIREVLPEYRPVIKRIFSCFGVDDFEREILATGRKRLIVAGIETHICVAQTVLDALHRGYAVQVLADAVSSRRDKDHAMALDRMAREGAVITTTEAAMYEIAARADDENFRRLLELVK